LHIVDPGRLTAIASLESKNLQAERPNFRQVTEFHDRQAVKGFSLHDSIA
jgi:hypothetical protein